MRPLTLTTPKPLLQVGGKPLIVWHLQRLAKAGVREVAINTSWLAERLHQALGNGAELGVHIHWCDEGSEPLETAGGIRNALPVFGDEPFLVVNGDVWTTVPLPAAPAEGRLAHLVLVPNPPQHPHGDFGVESGELRCTGIRRYTFSGIASYHPELFDGLMPGRRPLRPVLDMAAMAGFASAEISHAPWVDVGTPERLAALDAALA
jgi:MurNAc alpha-1-phosphate uridylyltransferase